MGNTDVIIKVENVSMQFNLYREKVDNIKEYIIRQLKKGGYKPEPFLALRDVSFSVCKGESLGIIGANGSGKSTMLKLLAGVMKPTAGKVAIRGAVAPLIELGAGFDFELTARENIFLNGAVLGHSRASMKDVFDEIVEFSELGEFIDVPIKNFSSGMLSRLGFSIATITVPDILMVDEVLSVGDFKFKEKCEDRLQYMMARGTNVLLVSHSMKDVVKICGKALWLDHGNVVKFGDARPVCDAYEMS